MKKKISALSHTQQWFWIFPRLSGTQVNVQHVVHSPHKAPTRANWSKLLKTWWENFPLEASQVTKPCI